MAVLVLTGYPNLFRADAFAGGPPATLFTKPVDYAALRSALRDALEPAMAAEAAPGAPSQRLDGAP
jgi:hypothetical protein